MVFILSVRVSVHYVLVSEVGVSTKHSLLTFLVFLFSIHLQVFVFVFITLTY